MELRWQRPQLDIPLPPAVESVGKRWVKRWKETLCPGVDTHRSPSAALFQKAVAGFVEVFVGYVGGSRWSFVQKAPILALRTTNSHLKSLRKTDQANKTNAD